MSHTVFLVEDHAFTRDGLRAALQLDPELRVVGEARSGESPLSPRELEVLRLIADGLNNKQIAVQLEISLSTVKTHVQEILERLAVSDRTQAAVKALSRGLI